MSENGHNPEQLEPLEPPGTDQRATGVPDRIDAGDGHGDYVYKRRGPFGRLRARGHRLVEVWLMNAAPRDADRPPQPGTATYTLAGTWWRKVATFTVALIAAVVMVAIVLMGL